MWDARLGPHIESQPSAPLLSAGEHGMTERTIGIYLSSSPDYQARFVACFGPTPSTSGMAPAKRTETIRRYWMEGAVKALACFMRELDTFDAPIDRYLQGDTWALDRQQKRGLAVFLNCTEASGYDDAKKRDCTSSGRAAEYFLRPLAEPFSKSCAVCHNGTNFATDFDGVHRWKNIGAGEFDVDLGRQIISGLDADIDAYKTPTLRELADTAPYGHRGQWATVRNVIDFKVRGGDPSVGKSRNVYKYSWTEQEKRDLEHFLLTAFQGDYKERIRELGIEVR
jgi:cytochrome c peroxidase